MAMSKPIKHKTATSPAHSASVRALTAKMAGEDPSRAGRIPLLERRRISIGEVMASRQPLIVQTLLGSCVAVCLRDPVSSIGGMNHILLPFSSTSSRAASSGVHAMELLINQIMSLGGNRKSLVAKAFGAANVLACLQPPTAGDRNAQFVRQFLAAEGIPLLAQRLGGKHAVQVNFRTDTGKTLVHSVDGSPLSSVLEEEETYQVAGQVERGVTEDVTLF